MFSKNFWKPFRAFFFCSQQLWATASEQEIK